MKKINLVIELEYDDGEYSEEFVKEILEEGFCLHPPLKDIDFGTCRVLSFGEVVNLIQEQKDRLHNEGYDAGYDAGWEAYKESLTSSQVFLKEGE